MSATFACPHCGASYPRKPVLVGRAVRCTTCKNAFRLREDGIADKVEIEAPAPVQPPQAPIAPAPMPQPAEATSKPVAPTKPTLASTGWGLDLDVDVNEPASAPQKNQRAPDASPPPPAAASPLPKDATGTTARKTERFTAQQLEARRAMAATLSTSMSAALKSEAVKREEQGEKTKAKKAEGQVGKIGPAILTGQGVEEARINRLIMLSVLGILALGIGFYWLVFTDSPERASINAYTAEVPIARIRAGERVRAIQERAWLIGLPPAQVGVAPLIDMRDARIGSTRTVNLSAAKDLFAKLKDLVPVEPGPVWVPRDRVEIVEGFRRPNQKDDDFIATVLKREKIALSNPAFLNELTKTGMSTEDAEIVDLFLRGRTPNIKAPTVTAAPSDAEKEKSAANPENPEGGEKVEANEKPVAAPETPPSATTTTESTNTIAERWIKGDVPATMHITRFYGKRGTILLSRGQDFKTAEVEYDGKLVRFTGDGWPQEWKILSISTKLKERY